MKSYDGAEVCQIAGLFLLNNLANKFNRNCAGDRLPISKNINGRGADKIRKKSNYLRETDYLWKLNAT